MIKRLNIFTLLTILIIFIGLVFILGLVIKLPKYHFFTGLKNDKVITFHSNCCKFKIGEQVSISDKVGRFTSIGIITNIENTKISIEASNIELQSYIFVIKYVDGSVSLLERIFKELVKL